MYEKPEKNRIEDWIESEGLTADDLTIAAEEIEKAALQLARCQGAASPKGLLELLAEWLREECMAFAVSERRPEDGPASLWDACADGFDSDRG